MTEVDKQLIRVAERIQAFIDEQRAAGKTDDEISDMLADDDERRHADRVEEEDRKSLERGY